jgi:hypothetical protein
VVDPDSYREVDTKAQRLQSLNLIAL